MKRLLHILLPAVCCLLTFACSREVEETPLYQKYAVRSDLTVAQVTGFHLNDTVKTDVVILVADDSVAWQGLKEELDIRTSEGVTTWMGNTDHPEQRVKRSERPAWRAMAVHADKTIAFYCIENDIQYEALLDYQMNELTTN
jgi:hypothetical protein